MTIVTNREAVDVGQELVVRLFAVDDVGVTERTLTLASVTRQGNTTTLDQNLALDATGQARLTITEDLIGLLTFTGSAKDGAGNAGTAEPVDATVIDPNDDERPTAQLFITNTGPLYEPTTIIGSVNDDIPAGLQWELTATPLQGGRERILGEGIGAIDNAGLGLLDTTVLANGRYEIRLFARDGANRTAIDTETVTIEGNYKPGRFTVSFVDLEVPVAGLPIAVTRTYDTLEADQQQDFGNGWSLDLSNTKLRVVSPDGTQASRYTPFVDGMRVVIELPDGTEEGFTFLPEKIVQGFIPTPDYIPKFIADIGVKSELIVDTRYIRKPSNSSYIDMGTGREYTPLDPDLGGSFQLNLRNGNELAINAQTGDLASITDRNGNQLRFTGNSIEHDSGRGITFERDNRGRIIGIIDPSGNSLTYEYDPATKNRVKFTNRVGAETLFTYQTDLDKYPEHFLDEIIDPLGRSAAKTEYDESGRAIRVTDANGKVIETDYGISGRLTEPGIESDTPRLQKTIDQVGNVRYMVFDSHGNLTEERDPEGGIIIRTFNNDDRLVMDTTVIGWVDSVENGETNDMTTSYDYDPDGNLTIVTDTHGAEIHSAYDEHGLPLLESDAFGNTIVTHYDDRGQPAAIRDVNGNVTQMKFDNDGNVTEIKNSESDVLVRNTYNEFGEILSSTSAHNRTTYFEYDDNGDQIATWTFHATPDGTPIQLRTDTRYDAERQVLGTQEFEIRNPDSNNPEMTTIAFSNTGYDMVGQPTETLDQFGNFEKTTYDLRGQQIETRRQGTNEAGESIWLLTRTAYDAAGREILTTDSFEEGTTESIQGIRYEYDGKGRVTTSERVTDVRISIVGFGSAFASRIDSIGDVASTRSTVFDSADRVLSISDNYQNTTINTYDQRGNLTQTATQVRDGNAVVWRISRIVYDEFGRTVVTTDQFLEAAMDSLSSGPVYATRTLYGVHGRVVRTQRLKDAFVELNAATGASTLTDVGTIELESSLVYNLDSQLQQSVSATGATTTYEYDSLGRQIATVGHLLPLAEVGASAGDKVPENAVSVAHRSETLFNGEGQVALQRTHIRQFDTGEIDDSNAQEMAFEYDHKGQQVRTIYNPGKPNETYSETTYDDFGRVIAETNQLELTRTSTYNDQGQLIAVTLPAIPDPNNSGQLTNPVYRYSYDAQGNMVQISDPLGRDTRFDFNDRGQQLSRTLPLGFGLDGMFGTLDDFGPDLTPNTGDEPALPEGEFTEHMEYDVRGRQSLHISFEGIVTEFLYDDSINGTGRLQQKRFYASEADYNNGLVKESQTMTYDAFGREINTVWDRDLTQSGTAVDTWTNEYDEQSRLLRVESPTGTVNYEYDEFGRQTRLFTGDGGTYSGDQADPVTDIRYSYDILGRLSKVEAIEKNDVTVDVDPNTAGNQPETESYAYTLNGSLDYEINPDGSTTDYTYDDLNRLTDIDEYRADTSTPDDFTDNPKLSDFSYTLRGDGKRDSADEIIYDTNGITKLSHTQFDWTYDDAGRLTDEVFTDVGNLLADAENYHTTFEYDLTSNRLKKTTVTDDDGTTGFDATTDTDEVITYVQDVNDRMTSEDQVVDGAAVNSTSYGFTGTQQTSKSVTSEISNRQTSNQTFAYDLAGRLSQVETFEGTNTNPSTIISYRYGTDGIRISATTQSDTNADGTIDSIKRTEYLIDARNHTGYQQVLEEKAYDVDPTTGTETLSRKLVYTIGHDQISQTTFTPGGFAQRETIVFHYDGHRSTRILTDVAGAIATVGPARQIFHFTAYGNAINFQMANAATQYLYSGEQFDTRIGQQYLRARYYNQANGTFNRLDPFFGNTSDPQSFHKYLYTHGDPITGIDPTGNEFSIGGLLSSMAIGGLINVGVGIGIKIATNRVQDITLKSMFYDFAIGAILSGIFYGVAWGWASYRAASGASAVAGSGASTLIRLPSWVSTLSDDVVQFTARVWNASAGRYVNGLVTSGSRFIGDRIARAQLMQWLDESYELYRLYSGGKDVVRAAVPILEAQGTRQATTGLTNAVGRQITISSEAGLSTLVHEMLHFRFLLSRGLWGRGAAALDDVAMQALRNDMEHRVLLGMRYFGFEIADDAIAAAYATLTRVL